MAENQNIQLENYKNLEKQLKGTLNREQTTSAQADLMSLRSKRKSLENSMLKDRWYGKEGFGEETRERDVSLLERGLHALNLPFYGVVGAAEAVLGKGSKKGLANIPANIKEGGTFGDLLRSYNVNNAAAMPLGFAMDIALDPVVWMTAGATALIPRVGLGLRKAGAKGAIKGLESSFLKKAAMGSKIIPKVDSVKLTTKALKAGSEYNRLVGRDIGQILDKGRKYPRLGEVTEELLSRSKAGRTLLNTFKYDNKGWLEKQMTRDIQKAEDIASGTIPTFRPTGTSPEDLARTLAVVDSKNAKTVKQGMNAFDAMKDPVKYQAEFDKGLDAIGQSRKIIDDGAIAATRGSKDARSLNKNMESKMTEEFMSDQELKRHIQVAMKDETGIRWFDKAKDKITGLEVHNPDTGQWEQVYKGWTIKDKKIGQSMVEGYEKYMGIFKTAKVPLNPSAYTNAVVGNAVMGNMAGVPVHEPRFISSVANSWKFVRNKLSKEDQVKFVKRLTDNPETVKYLDTYPGTFTNVFGIDPKFMKGSPHELVAEAIEQSSKHFDEAIEFGAKDVNDAKKMVIEMQKAVKEGKTAIPKKGQRIPGVTETLRATEITTGTGKATPSSFFASELQSGGFGKMMADIDKKIAKNPDSKFLKGLKWYFEKPMDVYSSIDQANKLGTFVEMTNTGLSERSILTLKNFIDIGSKDITQDVATGLYKLRPEKAVEAVQDIYMNYGAMPGAVKVLRSMPFLGAPFASFMYGMVSKTGKTLQHNPAIFNKINNFLHEFQGGTTPLEREKLDEPYYQWYKRDGMVKLPFFDDNPVYMNMANMIPYYTMNIFQPAERKYDDKITGKIMGTLDKLPFFKTPEGQVMLDYFIQPIILRESNPVGMFDQPLWPRDASVKEKAFYATRSMAEAPVPGVAGYAGILQGLVAPDTVKYNPSFRGRQFGYGVQGKSSLGIEGRESALSRTTRTIFSTFGLPWYKMNLTYGSKDNKK